ncbi:carcinine hydrolase/isopenicillin-N N-acyltransferase family protein [Catellatospora sichuanensis]|uniref:carcinine hydrolase/isopenicillin-N N-acyltransferase family protein n=1 Tax=Catellatospora sichuanensis TaxID=1969805 RepID=UPI00118253FE|nr:C45 family peptidase [Catellatospora sichuanensis]
MRRFGFVLLLVLASCTPTPASPPATGAASRQSAAEADATLASLRRVDDLPLYEMTYTGDYDASAPGPQPTAATPFGCSLFAAFGDPDRPVFGRNFDWDPNPALVLRADPPDGYASISLVDLRYLGLSAADDPRGDRRLLDAPLLPFDGLNERGLAVGMAADEGAFATPDPAKPTVGSVRILRLVLDQAATVDEAIAVFARHNIDFVGGPPLHYLLADASGASALVEFTAGRQQVERGTGRWQALTNVPLIGVGEQERRHDTRYRVLADTLGRSGGTVPEADALGLLRAVAQPHTRWSVTYDLGAGRLRVVTAQRWQTVHSFRLAVS